MSAFLDSVINNKPHSAGIHLACSTHRSGPGILRLILIHADKAINSAFTQPRSFANVLNISETAKEIHDKNMVFSPAALRELERDGLVTRQAYPEVPVRVEYSPTDSCRELLPILEQLSDWAEKRM